MAETLEWKYSPPVIGGGPVQGLITSLVEDEPLTVEFLWEIKGVPHQTIHDFVRENTFQPEGSDQGVRVRVLDRLFLLHGKIRNAVDIEQALPEKLWQDVKYLALLAEARHPGVIHWQELVLQRIQQKAFDRDVKASLRQLTGIGQSRGIGI